jgi:hypothetical protein
LFFGIKGEAATCSERAGLGDRGEGEVLGRGAVLLTPEIEEAAIAQGDVRGAVYGETNGGAVDPFVGALELGIVADGGFIDNAVTLAVRPLGTPLLIAKGGNEAEGEKDLGESFAVRNFGFSFNAVLVCGFAGTDVREAFVCKRPATGVIADAKNFSAGAHLAAGGVIENI